ncbi:hypothetical protein D915_006327 [Fasciola hepatica]|uniref:Uncharacterized protein n=1 Tax=Fasciola hepatica TaxID=6192 RepID=A0A4E0RZH5_FASHE|nr:hypothetical protein D915_006327 [Fasciola hepatica]
MYSRRRFSSHPVTAIRDSGCVSCTCTCGVKHDVSSTQCGRLNTSLQPPPSGNLHGCTHMNSSSRCGFPVSRGLQWRQSEPHLVTLSPLPIPSSAIQHYLARRSMCHLENECLRKEGAHSASPLKDPFKFSATCHPCCPSHCREKLLTGSTVPSVRKHAHLSECSTTSASDSMASSEPKCSSSVVETFASSCAALDPLPGALTAVATCVSSSRAPQTTTSHASTTYSGFRWGAYRRRRLPSSWSTTTNAGFITSELTNDESASICTGADKTGHSYLSTTAPSAGCSIIYGGSSFPGHSLSSGNSPQFHLTPLHPTCTVIPGSQYFTPHRRHTTSACEAVSFRSGFSSGGGATNGIGSMCSAFAHSSKASLISLTASAIPLWAEAPSKAKPRTGCNYVSREMLASLNSQRKHQHQHNKHSSPPPPPSTQHPRPSSGMGITNSPMNHPANSSTRTHPHPCTPVPEASKETETYTLPHAAELHSFTAAPLLSQYTESASVSSQITGRPYINMVPPSHRSGLKPIDECQLTSSDRTSNSEHPLVQCSVVEPSLISIPSSSNGPSLENTNELRDASALLPCASISSTGCSSNVHSRYVNFTSCVIPVNRGGHTDQNSSVCTQSSQYINIASAQNTLRPCLTDLRSGRCISSSPIASVPPKYQCHPKESKENHAITSSVSCSSSRYCVTDSPGLESSACYTPLCLHRNHSTPVTSTESCQKERVSSTLPVSTVESTLNNTPRLYYAHLMLSNESASRISRSPPLTSEFTSPASNRELASDSQRPNSHTFQCSPFASPSTSVTNAQSASGNMTSANDAITSSGLNYVTIDSVQTKALSELERELRGATGSESSSYSVLDPSSRRATIARTGMLSATLPGPSITSDTFSRGRAVERSSSHSGTGSGSKNGKSDGLGAWLPVRVWSRLVHSLSLHHTPSIDQNRNEKHGGRRRVGRANGSSKEVESVIVASTSLQN